MTLLAESLPHADHHPDEVFQADEADLRIDRIHQDLDKISALLEDEAPKEDQTRHQQSRQQSDILPVCLDIPNARHEVVSNAKTSTDRGSLLFLPVVEASIRNATRSASKVAGCDLLLALAERVPDEAKMNRILPYFIYLLRDKADIVRVAAIRSLTQLVSRAARGVNNTN